MIDDDFVLKSACFVESMFHLLLSEQRDLVACGRDDNTQQSLGSLVLEKNSNKNGSTFSIVPNVTRNNVRRSQLMADFQCYVNG